MALSPDLDTLYLVPEGPELETLRRQLSPHLPASVVSVAVSHPRSVRSSPLDLALLEGSDVSGVERFGKWLFLSINPGSLLSSHSRENLSVWVHLRMSGRLHLKSLETPTEKHTHVSLHLETSSGLERLDFVDPRTFGEVRLAPALDTSSMGVDLSVPVDASSIHQRVSSSGKPIKAVLLEQGLLVSGVGNYLADEICHSAGIPPTTPMSSLSKESLQGVLDKIPCVFEDFARLRGTALADEGWRDLYGTLGDGSSILQVHGRTHCRACATPVNRVKIAGRSAYICSTCQP